MAKTKRKNISDVKLSKPAQKKQNPFEVHINREKFQVLGQKSKFDKGLPGVARARAVKKRKETLLQEYKVQDKSNKFIDRRIGERNKHMTSEDKIMARFTAERMKAHKRKAMFNLAEEEVLTHKGRSITEVEKFDDPRSGDEDDDGKAGALDANFVEEAHFGGGMFSKSKNSRESVIDQLIADSKKRKIERQQTREKTLELTEKLDTEWKDLIPIITSGPKKDEEEDEVPNKGRGDPFDIALRELKFEARGKPSDKLKSEEEVAEAEAKRLRELEEERLRRMRGDDTQVTVVKKKHRSADDLDDNFQLDEDEDFSVMYDKDGNLILPKASGDDKDEDEEIQYEPHSTDDNLPDSVESCDEDEEEEDDDDDEEDDIDYLKEEIKACNESDGDSGDEESDSETELNDKTETEVVTEKLTCSSKSVKTGDREDVKVEKGSTGLSDKDKLRNTKKRKSKDSGIDQVAAQPVRKSTQVEKPEGSTNKPTCDDSISGVVPEQASIKSKKKVCFNEMIEEVKFGDKAVLSNQGKSVEQIREDLLKRKLLMDKARKELPYTYEAPKSYEDLEETLKGHDLNEVAVIVERIMKCHHPKLREENKQKMSSLFAFLMQYLNDLDNQESWAMVDRLAPLLFDLTMFSPANVAECLAEILKEKQSDYSAKKSKYPNSSTMVFLKLVPLLFPASDKRHPVTTPAMVFITQMLQLCKVTNRRSIASGLFLVTLVYEYVHLSKRICLQAINFLTGLLHLASPPANVKPQVVPPFKEQHRFLYLQNSFQGSVNLKLDIAELGSKDKIDDEFRIKSVWTCLKLLNLFLDLYESHTAVTLLFQPVATYLESFQIDKYPAVFKEVLDEIQRKIKNLSSKQLDKVTVGVKKPKALRLYEPSVEPVYDTKKKKGVSGEKAEQEKLLHKIKREKKGAMREIRRDRAFIAKIKHKQQLKSDVERMRKVKEIYGWGAQQQGEINALARLKKKRG